MKNKTTEEKILLLSDYFFTYLEASVALFVVFVMIDYGINTLHIQNKPHFLLQGYMFILIAYISFFITLSFFSFTKKIFKHKQPKKSVIHLMGMVLPVYLVIEGILDLQTEHFPEENYIYFGKNLIIIGVLGILYGQWRYKINKRKEIQIQ
jgi:magnesium-transporting ATPase (P-type)